MVKKRDIIDNLSPYIPGKPIGEVQRELGLDRVIKLASNENPLGNSPKATEAIKKWADNMALYPDGNATELKKVLADKLSLDTDQLLLGAGSDQILEYIAQTYISPGDKALMGDPSFPRYESVVKIMDGNIKYIPLTEDYRMDLDGFIDNIDDRTKLIWICNPNNPTGTRIKKEEQEAFIKRVPPHVLIILDEAYYEYAYDEDYPNSIELLDTYKNVIILRTFSKAYGLAGLRIGYAISNKETIDYINRVRGPFNANDAGQVAALAALEDEDFLNKTIQLNSEGKKYLYDSFERMNLNYIPSYGNFIMVDIKKDSQEVFKSLLKEGVIIRSGDIYGMDSWIRVTIGTMEENKLFISALENLINK